MTQSRTIHSAKNITMNFVSQMVLLALSFVSRSVFIHFLSIEYLGINGLFDNILSVLSLADLGVGTAINYALYRPLAQNDYKQIQKLIGFFQTIYRVIALCVLLLGLLVLPFLDALVNTSEPIPYLEWYYLIMLLSTVVSYLFVYKSALIIADQKNYLVTKVTMYIQILRIFLQIVVLVCFQNFILYLCVQLVTGILTNLWISSTANRLYPYLKEMAPPLEKGTRKRIFKDIQSIILYRFGGVVMNNTDDILISTIVGTVYVGLYSNYLLIVSTVNSFITMIFSSLTASIGSKNASSTLEEQERLYRVVLFFCFWAAGFSAVCFYTLLNDFIQLWLGSDFLFSTAVVIAICLQFYVPCTLTPTSMYRDTTGIFKETKYVFLVTAAINLVLSIWMGQKWGILGILTATTIARLLTNFWFEPLILYQNYFKMKAVGYFRRYLLSFVLMIAEAALVQLFSQSLPSNVLVAFVLKMLLCVVVVNVIQVGFFYRTEEFTDLKNYFLVICQHAGLIKRKESRS